MTDIQRLKRLNIWEKLGWKFKKKKKKIIKSFIAIVIICFVISSVQSCVQSYNYENQVKTAQNYITKSEICLDKVNSSIKNISDRLENHSNLYKDYEYYIKELDSKKVDCENLVLELDEIKNDFDKENINKVLYQFKSEEGENNLLFTDKIKGIEKSLDKLNSETAEVIELDTYLISNYPRYLKFKDSLENRMTQRYDNLNVIQLKGKNDRVKNKSNKFFTYITDNKRNFINGLDDLIEYTKSAQGTLSLDELREMKTMYLSQDTLLEKVDSSIENFDNYWDDLHEQYYTIVKNHYSSRETDYVTEDNPKYREWTETETYEDTETYTETVYVGSRIVGDEKQDIYEEVTKERPVTKTRNVTKNNGQPETISVPYDVYTYYYTVEKHTKSGITEISEEVGEKHEKYDSSIKSWNYDENEEIGYIEWKQLWNDSFGIVRGKKLSPKLE